LRFRTRSLSLFLFFRQTKVNYYITLFTIENPLSSKRGKFPLRQNVKVLKCSHFLLIQASPFSLRRAIPQSQILILFPLSVEGHNRGLSYSINKYSFHHPNAPLLLSISMFGTMPRHILSVPTFPDLDILFCCTSQAR